MSVSCWVYVSPPSTCRRRRWARGALVAAAAPSLPRAPWWRRTLCWRSFVDCRGYGLPSEMRLVSEGGFMSLLWLSTACMSIFSVHACTSDGSAYFGGGCLSHLQRGLFAVPGGVRCADQVGGVFQRPLGKTVGQAVREREGRWMTGQEKGK